jgi:serine/threonine-protein kinase RsbW
VRRGTSLPGGLEEVGVTQESLPHSRRASVAEQPNQDFVEVRLPADSAYLSVLRTATAGLAARLDFTLDEIEDLRIAVDEACAMLLAQVVQDSTLTCRFELGDDSLLVDVSAPTRDGALPSRETFAWTVLSALAGNVEAGVNDDRFVHIRMRKRRGGATS